MRKILLMIFTLTLSGGAMANNYPTVDTVRMVIDCMHEIGQQNEETLYTCTCRHDVIESNMTFYEYEQGRLYERHQDMSGKKGGIMRDAAGHARKLYAKLKEVRQKAERSCPVVRHLEAPRLKQGERVTGEEIEEE